MADSLLEDFSEVSSPDITDDELEDSPPVISKKPKDPNDKSATEVSCWSMNLEAFILNTHIFNEKHFIAPLNRPDNSAFLPGAFSAPDVIPFVDIDGAYPWHRNSRIADVAKIPNGPKDHDNMLRVNRLGVYLHWTLPQHFRSGQTKDTGKNAGNVAVSETYSLKTYCANPSRSMHTYRIVGSYSVVLRRLMLRCQTPQL